MQANTGTRKKSLKIQTMLSIEQCRKLIDDKNLSDEEVEQIRGELYVLANLAFDHWKDTKNSAKKPLEGQESPSKQLFKE